MTAVAAIGHNGPPTPFDECVGEVEKYYDEAKLWLDGDPVTNQEMADGISKLMEALRQTKKMVNDRRVEEKKPFDEGAAEVQARYKPLIEKCDNAVTVCKKAITPWLEKREAEQRAEAEAKRAAAEAAAKEAEEARRAARESADLEATEQAEALTKQAEKAGKSADKASKSKAHAKGGARAVSLRTKHVPTVTNYVEAAKYFWANRRNEMNACIDDLVAKEVAHGARDIPGVEIVTERTAV